MSYVFIYIFNFIDYVVGLDLGDLVFYVVFIRIYLDFDGFFGDWFVGEYLDLYFVVVFDVVVD